MGYTGIISSNEDNINRTGIISSKDKDYKNTKARNNEEDEEYIPKADHNISNILDRIDMNIKTGSNNILDALVHTSDGSSNKVVKPTNEIVESDLKVPSNVYKKPDSPIPTIKTALYSTNTTVPIKTTTSITTSTTTTTTTTTTNNIETIDNDNFTTASDNITKEHQFN